MGAGGSWDPQKWSNNLDETWPAESILVIELIVLMPYWSPCIFLLKVILVFICIIHICSPKLLSCPRKIWTKGPTWVFFLLINHWLLLLKFKWTDFSWRSQNSLSVLLKTFFIIRNLLRLDWLVKVLASLCGQLGHPRCKKPNKNLPRRLRGCRSSARWGTTLLGGTRSDVLHNRSLMISFKIKIYLT